MYKKYIYTCIIVSIALSVTACGRRTPIATPTLTPPHHPTCADTAQQIENCTQ